MPAGYDSPRDSRDSRDRRSSRDRSSDRSDRRRRSRSRSRSHEREERRERRKKKSGWDQQPEQMPIMTGFPDMAAHAPVSGSIHPSRMPQLGNLPGAIPGAPMAAYNPLAHLQGGVPAGITNMLPPHLAALMSGQMGGAVAGGASAPAAAAVNTANLPGTRQARRLYVGAIPVPMTENELKTFFVDAMRSAFPDIPGGDCVISVYLNLDKKFAFVEMRTPEEATTGMGLDGISMRGQTLRIKRPSDYNPAIHGNAPSASRIQPHMGGGGGGDRGAFTGQVSSQVPDGPNKVFCGGLPYSLSEEEVKELLGSFGQLRAFHLVKERESNTSKGYCFFEFVDPNMTDAAVMGLNNLKIGDKTLTVRRAQPKSEVQPGMGVGMNFGGPPMPTYQDAGGVTGLNAAQLGAIASLRAQGGLGAIGALAAAPPSGPAMPPARHPPTRVLVLLQMVVPDILRDDQEYNEIFEDIDLECRRYGEVRSVIIPRPRPDNGPVNGLGKVFVEFASVDQALKARAEVEGRQFDGRTVNADFWPEDKYARRELD